jgi:DNA-directed RNA polymerase subunit RPC12/RpoP
MGGALVAADTRSTMRRRPHQHPSLEICADCGADYVNPFAWEAVEDHSWWMALRCAECGHEREVVVANAEAERFDEALDRRADPIARALHRIDAARMKAWVESVTVALQRDLIDAADFAR